jgi:peptidoglycan-N-acetylglucosamine deacetylase
MAIVTTSWDDGHPLDVRLADLLCKYGLRGTFYVPLKYEGHDLINSKEISRIRQLGMEIGSHTLTHSILTQLNPQHAFKELIESKELLEDILGEPVLSFCYPKGKRNKMLRSSVIKAGYALARTTISLRIEDRFDQFCMPVTLQFFQHSRTTQIKHALKDMNLKGIINYIRLCKMETDLNNLSDIFFDYVLTRGGIFHIWGHSWEIEKFGLWDSLEGLFKGISKHKDVNYLTNLQTLDMAKQSQPLRTNRG